MLPEKYGPIEKLNQNIPQTIVDNFVEDDPNYQGIKCLMSSGDRFRLYYTTRFLLPDSPVLFVDLGTYNGGSTLLIYNTLTRTGRDFRGYTVDSYDQEAHKEPKEIFLNQVLPKIQDKVEFLQETTTGAAKHIPSSISLLLIDAGHDLSSVYGDIEDYLPLMQSNGVILLHDYIPLDYQSFARYDPAHDCFWIGNRSVLFGTAWACSKLLDPFYEVLDTPLLAHSWRKPPGYNLPGILSLIRGYRV